MVKIIFGTLQQLCKFCTLSRDMYDGGYFEYACHCESNIPKGASWGICSVANCPFVKSAEE